MHTSSSYDIVTFGEGLIRLSPPPYERLEQSNMFDVYVSGESVEVAVGASRLGLQTRWLTGLANNSLGRKVANKAQEHGVDTRQIKWMEEGRVGLCYMEPGSAPRATHFVYDREASSFGRLQIGDMDWSVLQECRVFHVDGTIPFWYPEGMRLLEESIEKAQSSDCLLSICIHDNVLAVENQQRLFSIYDQAHILMVTEQAARQIVDRADSLKELANQLKRRFERAKIVLTAGRLPTPRTGTWQAVAMDDEFHEDRSYEIEVIDAEGALGGFISGFLAGYLKGGLAQGLHYGNAAAALAHSIPGNLSWMNEEDIVSQLSGEGVKLQR